MRDHGLFQAICRVNRLDGEDKEHGNIVHYKDLFKSLKGAVQDYISGALDSYTVRRPNGAMNPESFTNDWGAWNKEIESTAASHQWTLQQIDEVIHVLERNLPNEGATALWLGFLKRQAQRPGFVRYNLHRKLRTA